MEDAANNAVSIRVAPYPSGHRGFESPLIPLLLEAPERAADSDFEDSHAYLHPSVLAVTISQSIRTSFGNPMGQSNRTKGL